MSFTKQNKTNLVFLRFTILLACFIFYNCQKDDDINKSNIETSRSRYIIKTVDKDFFETDSDLSRKLNGMTTKLKENKNSSSNLNREVYNVEYGFTIETNFVKYVEDNISGYHSYSFPIRRDVLEDDNIENLVFHSNDKGTYDAFIVKYGFTKNDYEILETEILENLTTKYTSIVFDELDLPTEDLGKMVYGCSEAWDYLSTTEHSGQLHGASQDGTCSVPGCAFGNSGWVLTGISCSYYDDGTDTGSGTGYDGNTGTNTNGTGTNTTGGSPTGNATPQYPIISTPIVIQTWQEVVACVNGETISGTLDNTLLNGIMITELQDSKPLATQANDFLNQNACSEEAQAFVIFDILTFMNPYVSPEIEQISVDLLTDDCTKLIVRDEIIGDEDSVGTNANLLNSIRNTFSLDNNVNLVFRNADDVPVDANASADFDSDENIDSGVYDIYITFSNDYLAENPTKLSRALITIHEMVHAKLMYSYLQGTLLMEYPEYTNLNTTLMQFLENRNIVNGQALNDAMHIAMVDFIGSMSYSLYQYAQNSGMTNITHQYCKEITKGSFYGTPAMPLIGTGASSAEELGIKTQNEQNNEPNAQGDDC